MNTDILLIVKPLAGILAKKLNPLGWLIVKSSANIRRAQMLINHDQNSSCSPSLTQHVRHLTTVQKLVLELNELEHLFSPRVMLFCLQLDPVSIRLCVCMHAFESLFS